jgi:hypothetical protein
LLDREAMASAEGIPFDAARSALRTLRAALQAVYLAASAAARFSLTALSLSRPKNQLRRRAWLSFTAEPGEPPN